MENDQQKKPGGRKKQDEVRPQWRVRLPPELGAEVVESAKQNGRSISEEIEYRVLQHQQYTIEITSLRNTISSAQKSLDLLEEMHQERDETRKNELTELRKFVAEMEEIYKDRNVSDLVRELEGFGFRKIALGDGSFLWAEPGTKPNISLSRLEAALLADKLSPILQRSVAEAIARFQEEYPHEG